MDKNAIIEGIAAPLPIANLDTDQIMPKQFLRGIDKAGLAQGLFYDMRFDEQGKPREDFVLNKSKYAKATSSWAAKTLAVVQVGSMRYGASSRLAYTPSSHPASRKFFIRTR